MGRNKAMTKRRKDVLLSHTEPGISGPSRPKKDRSHQKSRLCDLLPRHGFDWDLQDDVQATVHRPSRVVHQVPNLNPKYVYRIQDAIRASYDNTDRDTFDYEMGRIVARAIELDPEGFSLFETEPREFWQAVRMSLVGEDSFATHPRMTPATLHAFVAYALESRLACTDNQVEAWGNLVKAMDGFHNEFIGEPWVKDTDIWVAYYERSDKARWVAGRTLTAHDSTDSDDDVTDTEDDSHLVEEGHKVFKSEEFVVEEESDEDVVMGESTEDVVSTAGHTCQTASEHTEGDFTGRLCHMRLQDS